MATTYLSKISSLWLKDLEEQNSLPVISAEKRKAIGDYWANEVAQLENLAKKIEEAPMDGALKAFLSRQEDEMLIWYPRNQNAAEGYNNEDNVVIHPIKHFNVRDLLARFFIESHFNRGEVGNWRNNVVGISSMYFGHLAKGSGACHLPMFDYDGKNIKTQIRKDVKLLQKEFDLGDAWIYETRRGFHVYFFTDIVPWSVYAEMLESVNCCRGFKRSATSQGYAVLRVSAKYTEFDIKFLYVLAGEEGTLRRMNRKAHLIRALINLGTQCGTHFASMFPQWAHYREDTKEWKPQQPNGAKGKRIRKVVDKDLWLQELKINPLQQEFQAIDPACPYEGIKVSSQKVGIATTTGTATTTVTVGAAGIKKTGWDYVWYNGNNDGYTIKTGNNQ